MRQKFLDFVGSSWDKIKQALPALELKILPTLIRLRRQLAVALTVPILGLLHHWGLKIDNDTIQVAVDSALLSIMYVVIPKKLIDQVEHPDQAPAVDPLSEGSI